MPDIIAVKVAVYNLHEPTSQTFIALLDVGYSSTRLGPLRTRPRVWLMISCHKGDDRGVGHSTWCNVLEMLGLTKPLLLAHLLAGRGAPAPSVSYHRPPIWLRWGWRCRAVENARSCRWWAPAGWLESSSLRCDPGPSLIGLRVRRGGAWAWKVPGIIARALCAVRDRRRSSAPREHCRRACRVRLC